jgi:superfamily II DNA or RNA helicase
MTNLADLTIGALVRGILDRPVRVVQLEWHGSEALTLTYTDESGRPGQELLYRDDEPRLTVEGQGRAWSMDADGHLFRLVSEAKRISLAYLFDPYLAVQISTLDPLPHQIDAVYTKMLARQPLRFLLADDPGAGKTIMAGLFCKELVLRGDVERCLVIAPGSLVEQWQDELWSKFHLPFDILTRDMIEASRIGNPFAERHLLIARLDHLSRNEDLQTRLAATDWDLIVVDEAHKMAAHWFGREVKETKRYRLGKLAGTVARHLLLMSATPHSGKEDDFQLFMALLDADRFVGKARGKGPTDTSDLMRRLVKEELLKFDGTKLFPERRAFTAVYPLSDDETLLYKRVTEYVQEEMNRADRLKAEGEGRRGAVVGFALTTLQRRLASSPEAIYQSLVRRRKRLEARVAEERLRRQGVVAAEIGVPKVPDEFRDAEEEFDVDDLQDGELEDLEEELVDQASAARTIAELEWEISRLQELEELAYQVRRSGADRKWEELSDLLQHTPEMFDAGGRRRKLIVFTEHRDTLNYLVGRLRGLFGRTEAVVAIHGQMPRAERRTVQEAFTQDRNVLILVATDAAGEGVNLQRAHLMVNYDLPWNPNRIEQRFGRVHRIGQKEVCSLWNLVADDTREGQVFQRLFEKLEEQRRALGGQVFDVLGEAFRGRTLRELLIDAIRYGERPEVKEQLTLVVDAAVGDTLKQVVDERALVADVLTSADVERIRDDMERADARRLQPHFIRSFLLEAFSLLGGTIKEREPGRYEITHVPAELRRHGRQLGVPLLRRYERVTFHKGLVALEGRPLAEFCCPGHPLLDGTIDLIVGRYAGLLTQGAVLVDENDPSDRARVLVYLQHAIQDGRTDRAGNRRVVSKRFEFVEVDRDGVAQSAGWAPFLDLRPATAEELALAGPVLDGGWVRDDLEKQSLDHGVQQARAHLEEVRRRTLERVDRTTAAVRERLTIEIRYWDRRANQLKDQELAGKLPKSGMNSGKARQRADELEARLARRLEELDAERQLSPLPPVVVGGALVLPAGLLTRLGGTPVDPTARARETARVERAAVDAVLATERHLGRTPVEMPHNNKGYDIESKDADGRLWFIEVKGRIEGAETVTVTKSEIGVGRNKPDEFILALVEVPVDGEPLVRYLRQPFDGSGDLPFGTISVTFAWKKLADRGEVPA